MKLVFLVITILINFFNPSLLKSEEEIDLKSNPIESIDKKSITEGRESCWTVRCNKCWKSFDTVADMHDHTCVQSNSVIEGLSPVMSSDSLDSVVIHGLDSP